MKQDIQTKQSFISKLESKDIDSQIALSKINEEYSIEKQKMQMEIQRLEKEIKTQVQKALDKGVGKSINKASSNYKLEDMKDAFEKKAMIQNEMLQEAVKK